MADHRNVKGSKRNDDACEDFWEHTEHLLAAPGVDMGTIMNFPCLRVGGEFFGMPHHETGDAVMKLPRERVAELVEAGQGQPFGPGGKVFKEWVLVDKEQIDSWLPLLDEAIAFNTKT